MALRQRDAAGGGKEETAELYGDGDGAEAGQPAHARGPVPKWSEQLTARGLVVSAAVGIMYSVIVMKLNLTTGLDPTLNVSAALISFVILRGWTHATARLSFAVRPLTRQENTVIQTCAVACYGISSAGQDHASRTPHPFAYQVETLDFDALFDFPGGFGSYLLGHSKKTYEAAGTDIEGNVGWKEPGIGWMTGYLFAVSFVGILALVPLRKVGDISHNRFCLPNHAAPSQEEL
ncbi:hypothetical protein ACQ4PT_060262 [Festuca glaucescens]